MKKPFCSRFSKLSLAIAVMAASVLCGWGKPKHLLVVTATQGFRHSSIPTAENVLATMGQETGLFTVDYVRGGQDGKGAEDVQAKMSAEALKQYDGVIFANTTGDLPLPDKDAFIQWIKSGKAFIGMHSASDTFHTYPAYIEMLGGEFLTHGAQAQVECRNQDMNHASTRHLAPNFTVLDEIYLLKNFHRDQVHGLLTLDRHPNSGMPGDYPIAWSKQVGKGRIFYTSLGHPQDFTEESFRRLLANALFWTAGREVPAK